MCFFFNITISAKHYLDISIENSVDSCELNGWMYKQLKIHFGKKGAVWLESLLYYTHAKQKWHGNRISQVSVCMTVSGSSV